MGPGSRVFFALLLGLSAAAQSFAASLPPDPNQRYREGLIRHQNQLRKNPALARAATAPRRAVTDFGDVAVVAADSTTLIRNPWVLNGEAVQITPRGNGYSVERISLAFDSNLGTKLDLVNGVNPRSFPEPGDDAYVLRDLGFTFPFYGVTYTSVAISSNGNALFQPAGMPQAVFDDFAVHPTESLFELQDGPPRIAPFWHDLDGRAAATTGSRGVYFRAGPDNVLITWNRMLDFPNDPSRDFGEYSFQLVLYSDGRIQFVFRSIALTSTGLTGISPGAAVNEPEEISFANPPDRIFTGAVAEFFSVLPIVDFVEVIRSFYTSRPGRDVWDFFYLLTDFPTESAGFASYIGVRNSVRGIGLQTVDLDPGGLVLGTRRMQGVLYLPDMLAGYPELPTTRFLESNSGLSVFGQEQGHAWGVFFRHPGADPLLLLGRDNAHWSFFAHTESAMSTPAAPRSSSMEGNVWIDNANGTFTSTGLIDGYSPFDQYAMGLRPPDQVPPMFVITGASGTREDRESAPLPNETVRGTRVNVTIDDVIQANGPRLPPAGAAPTQWRAAFVLLTAGSIPPLDAAARKVARYRLAWESYFAQATGYLGSLDTSLGDSSEVRRIAVVSAADYSPAVAPAGIATIFGAGLTTGATEQAGSLALPTSLAGVTVLVNGEPAPLYRVSPTQINLVMPSTTPATSLIFGRAVSSGSATIEILRGGELIRAGSVQVAPAVPSIFTANASGSGPGAVLDAITFAPAPFNARQSNGEPNILAVFCTGLGVDASGGNVSGQVSARIGGQSATVLYAGRSDFPGMNQVNVVLPAGLAAGTHTLELIRNGVASNPVTIEVR
jgi:uncharacterized protein (TIGR03437 family)